MAVEAGVLIVEVLQDFALDQAGKGKSEDLRWGEAISERAEFFVVLER